MDYFINFFEHIDSWQRTLLAMGGLVFFWILEGFVPLVHFSYSKMRHACPNLFLTFTTLLVNLSFAYVLVRSSEYVSQNRLGLLQSCSPGCVWIMAKMAV